MSGVSDYAAALVALTQLAHHFQLNDEQAARVRDLERRQKSPTGWWLSSDDIIRSYEREPFAEWWQRELHIAHLIALEKQLGGAPSAPASSRRLRLMPTSAPAPPH